MRGRWPLVPIVAGVLLFLGGFLYDVMYAGIPYQDPTAEMVTNYVRHARIAATLRWWGLAVTGLGALSAAVHALLKRRRPTARP